MKRQYLSVFGLVLVMLALTGAATSPSAPPRDNATIPQPRSSQAELADMWGKMPLYFVANQGQVDESVDFYVQGSDKTLYFTPEGVTFALTGPTTGEGKNRWIVKLDFVDANAVRPSGQAQTDAVISYFKGPQEEWHTGLPTYSQIAYRDLWQGIDLMYSGTVNRLKYEFVVQPGADPARIRLAYRGATVRLNDTGQLEVSTPAGGFQDDAPMAYQEVDGQRTPVAVAFALEDATMSGADAPRSYGFRLGAYNPALPLVIDPAVLVYCGYIGGSGTDYGNGIAVDSAGNAYITGQTNSISTTFPVTIGPDLTYNDGDDAFVAKVRADGTGLVYAGYIGGFGGDGGNGIAVDTEGNAYVTGWTNGSGFPVTVGPVITYSGNSEAFVAKVITDGTRLVYAGYIGGTDRDIGQGIAVDAAGNAYVTGYTFSTEPTFPVLVGPDLTNNNGGALQRDAFVTKVKADGTGFVYSGFIGGSGYDDGLGIAVDSAGSAYVAGFTDSISTTFPVTVGPSINYNGGMYDAFVAKVKVDGTGLAYAGYIGGNGWDLGYGIAVDSASSAYVTGWTGAPFPVTVGPDLTFNGGLRDAFVAKVNADGTGLVYAGYLGGNSDDDYGTGIAVDSAGNAYVTGYTKSTEATFPEIRGPDLTYNGGYYDAFVAKVRADGTRLMYCGYIGGDGWDQGNSIAVDSAGNAYVTGYTASISTTFPVTVGPDLTYNLGTYDAFVAKVFFSIENSTTTVASSLNPSAYGQSVTFTATVSGGAGTPTGTVQFKVDGVNLGTPVTLVGGSASVSTAALAIGVHTVTAEYDGNTIYDISTGTLSGRQVVDYPFKLYLPLVLR